MFLQMVVGFGLSSRFDNEFLRKLVLDFASRRDMAKLSACLGFGEKMGGLFFGTLKKRVIWIDMILFLINCYLYILVKGENFLYMTAIKCSYSNVLG